MFEKYWRTLEIGKWQAACAMTDEGGRTSFLHMYNYDVTYQKSFFSMDVKRQYFTCPVMLVDFVSKLPHKERKFFGFNDAEEESLELCIEQTMQKLLEGKK